MLKPKALFIYCFIAIHINNINLISAAPDNITSRYSDFIAFPDDSKLPKLQSTSKVETSPRVSIDPGTIPRKNSSDSVIPLDFLYRINDYTVNDLLLNYVDDYEDDFVVASRFGDAEEKDSAVLAKRADCMPELVTVKIIDSPDPSVLYLPSCTRIERCGGCCSHSLFACQPVEVEAVPMKVLKTQYTGGSKLKFRGREIVLVERHTKCKCACKVHAEECTKYQQYDPHTCRCHCINHDEEEKCHKQSQLKLWEPTSCTCRCREITQCTTGSYFDSNECKCKVSQTQRVYATIGGLVDRDHDDYKEQDDDPKAYYQTSEDVAF